MPKHAPPKSTPDTPKAPDDSDPSPALPTDQPKWSRWVAPAALVCALIAVVLAAWSLLKPVNASTTAAPLEGTAPAPVTDQQVADAEARACMAFNLVRRAVILQTNPGPETDSDATDTAVASARLSLAAGSAYLRSRLDPATPPPLALEIRSFADQLDDVAINQLAGVPNDDPAQAARMSDTDAAMSRLGEICG